ncbi:D-alanyl-D-alanine carboxypeptidase/D-alanyl-D-alanine-endopeptidase [Demequina sp. SO4-13]|uniref:D-alanyl-D-alanine carboxypeptidase/D-alanyl-D-alanine endopeptidase n=1 Tax=Demequina sp. SO4-13 TaxID=3401027 RepID=UPI003AF47C2E
MRRKALAGILVPAFVIGGAALYATADAYDLVPGFITADPVPVAPAPFLTHAAVSASPAPASAVSFIGDDAPVPSAARLEELARAVRDDPRTGTSTNISVIDVVTGDVLVDLDAADPQVPASSTKLLTAVSAVADLGPDFQMITTATWEPGERVLTLVAGGDMMLAAGEGHHGEGEDANGYAGVADLAEAIALAAPSALDGSPISVAVDDSAFEGPAVNPDWPQYALDQGYIAAATGLAVDAGRTSPETYASRYDDPSVAAGEDFAAAVTELGATVSGEVERAASPAGASAVAAVPSAPLSDIVALLLRESDNTIAEIVARVHAMETGRPTTPAGAADATIAGLSELGVPVEGLVLRDGAGFSERNRISAQQLTSTITAGREAPNTSELLDWLPVGGLEGTVAARYAEEPAAGSLRAKTGSLTGVTALAGTVQTADGRLLAFAMLADGMEYNPQGPRDAFDEMVNALAQCGCE